MSINFFLKSPVSACLQTGAKPNLLHSLFQDNFPEDYFSILFYFDEIDSRIITGKIKDANIRYFGKCTVNLLSL